MIRARLASDAVPERIVIAIQTDHDANSRLWWETTAGTPPMLPDRLDPVAIALVPKAMNFNQDLRLEGRVSWSLLANLQEYIDAWTKWRPDIFQPIEISADEVVDDRGTGAGDLAGRAVAAFSGGVDGTYATLAHQSGALGHRALDVTSAVLIHGFDIPLDDDHGFGLAATSARAITAELDVPLVTMRTNWQDVADPEWQMTFGAAIGAVLHLFTDRASVALMAADNTYDHVVLPWGSNPVTSPMLASERMRLVLAGGGTSRTDKCRVIGGYQSVREHIRVCWAGDQLGQNCGECEKCVRTKVNFLAAGHGTIPALGALEPGQLRTITIGSEGARAIYEEMLDTPMDLPPELLDDVRWLVDQARSG